MRRIAGFWPWVFLFGVFVLVNPYQGIRHDASLYLGQILHILHPELYAKDLFFAFENQSSFTIFPSLMAWFAQWISPGYLMMAGTGISLGLFFAMAALWATSISKTTELNSPYIAPALLLPLVVFQGWYGSFMIFSYGENFFTARSLGEFLTLLALWTLWLSKVPTTHRYGLTLITMVVATLIHPLMALPGWGMIMVHTLLKQPKTWKWMPLILAIPIPMVIFLDIFATYRGTYDEEWLASLADNASYIMITHWDMGSLNRLLLAGFVLFLGCRFLSNETIRHISKVSFLSLCAGILITLVGVDFLHSSFIGAIQPWRVQWLAQWIAWPVFTLLVFHFFEKERWSLRTIALLSMALWVPVVYYFENIHWMLYPLIILFLAAPKLALSTSKGSISGVLTLVLLFGGGLLTLFNVGASILIWFHSQSEHHLGSQIVFGYPIVIFVFSLLFVKTIQNKPDLAPFFMIFGLVFAGWNLAHWDQRSEITKTMEHMPANPNVFGVQLEPGAQILWYEEILAPWLILQRPSYFHADQYAGSMFSRKTAMDGERRMHVEKILRMQLKICDMNRLAGGECVVDPQEIKAMCEDADGKLDYIVLTEHVRGLDPIGTWDLEILNVGTAPYKLHSCKKILKIQPS